MIAVDTNILVYSHREESAWHVAASEALRSLAEGRSPWAIPWPCIHEFVAVVTHPRIFRPPTPLDRALARVDALLSSPSLALLAEDDDHWQLQRRNLLAGKIVGRRVHDSKIASICAAHGVAELWSADRDFGRFPGFKVTNPLVG